MIRTKFINGSQISLSDKCKEIMGSSRNGNIYELNLVNIFYTKIIKRNKNPIFIDIGSNTGSYSLLPTFDKNVICHAFEPNIHAFNVLNENVKLNNIENNVFTYKNGFWSSKKTLYLKVPLDKTDSGLSTFGDNPKRFKYDKKSGKYEEQMVECLTVDDFVMEKNLIIDAIKIDTEGAELDILKGAVKTLKEQKPLLLLEYDDKNTQQFNYLKLEIKKFLEDVGYNGFDLYKLSDIFVY